MICDRIKNAKAYIGIDERLEKVFEKLASLPKDIAEGTVVDFGNGIFGTVMIIGTTDKATRRFETHRKFTDIHYIIDGEEMLGYTNLENTSGGTGYDEEKDIEFYDGMPDTSAVHLYSGSFCMTAPEDAHKPCCSVNGDKPVKRIVAKIPVK